MECLRSTHSSWAILSLIIWIRKDGRSVIMRQRKRKDNKNNEKPRLELEGQVRRMIRTQIRKINTEERYIGQK